jgi:hypothetical protein
MKHETEMWVVEGRNPVLWTIPVYVRWCDDGQGEMMYAVSHLLNKQLVALNQQMAEYARPVNGLWVVSSRHALKRTAHLVPGGDPECYFSWGLPRESDKPRYKPEKRVERDEFLDTLFVSGGTGLDRPTLEFVWRQICLHMGNWLINREKPVDFYFFTLHPSPYRTNWRELAMNRFTKMLAMNAVRKRPEDALGRMDSRGIFISPELFAIDPKYGTCYRRIEVEMKMAWWKNVIRNERIKMERLGPHEYANDFTSFCIRCLDRTRRLFFSFLSENERPAPIDVAGDAPGTYRFVPPGETGAMFHTLLEYPAPRAAIDDLGGDSPKALPETNGSVSEVSDIQPQAQDVRDAHQPVPQSENGSP